MGGFRKLDETPHYAGRVIDVAVARFETPDGDVVEREIARHPGAVAVVAVDGTDVILVRQYRAALERELLEIPAGKLDVSGEAPEACAHRELVEEIGYEAAGLELLAQVAPTPGFCDETVTIYLATSLRPARAAPRGAEERHMTIVRVPLADISAVLGEQPCDAKTVIGLLLARERLGVG